jgi:hypothetical protein
VNTKLKRVREMKSRNSDPLSKKFPIQLVTNGFEKRVYYTGRLRRFVKRLTEMILEIFLPNFWVIRSNFTKASFFDYVSHVPSNDMKTTLCISRTIARHLHLSRIFGRRLIAEARTHWPVGRL